MFEDIQGYRSFSLLSGFFFSGLALRTKIIFGKWKGPNCIEGNEGGVHMNMEIDEETQYLANGKLTVMVV